MIAEALQELVDGFTGKIAGGLDADKLDGPIRLDPTRTVVIVPVKGRSPVHVHVNHQINDEGVKSVLHQISLAPSLKGLLKSN